MRALIGITLASLLIAGCSFDQGAVIGPTDGGDGDDGGDGSDSGGSDDSGRGDSGRGDSGGGDSGGGDSGGGEGGDSGGGEGGCTGVGSPETCNGLDDDCNGVVDDGAAGCASTTGCDVFHRSGGNTYLMCDIDSSWAAGSAICSGVGYTMVTMTDAAEETYLLGLMRMYAEWQWWGGLCDLNGDGVYDDDEWEGPDSSFRNWQDSQPNEMGHCARIRDTDGRWDDQPTDFGRGAICESAPP